MNDQSIAKAFENAYNNFDSRPLSGETMRGFYIDDFTKDAVKSIRTTIKISERFRKMLVIGHRGCGNQKAKPYSLVFWITPEFEKELFFKAPDFHHWVFGTYDFTEPT